MVAKCIVDPNIPGRSWVKTGERFLIKDLFLGVYDQNFDVANPNLAVLVGSGFSKKLRSRPSFLKSHESVFSVSKGSDPDSILSWTPWSKFCQYFFLYLKVMIFFTSLKLILGLETDPGVIIPES